MGTPAMHSGGLHIPFGARQDLVGRGDDLARVHEALQSGSGSAAITPAITGQGGIGKTQLAVLYAHMYGPTNYPGGVFWLNAANPQDWLQVMSDYARALSLPEVTAPESAYDRQRALQWLNALRGRRDVLLIGDNLQDAAHLRRDVPGLQGHALAALGCSLLVTTRLGELPGCRALPLDVLAPSSAVELLLKEAERRPADNGEEAAAERICRLLGNLPLALRLAGARLRGSRVTLDRFADPLRERGALDVVDGSGQPLHDY